MKTLIAIWRDGKPAVRYGIVAAFVVVVVLLANCGG